MLRALALRRLPGGGSILMRVCRPLPPSQQARERAARTHDGLRRLTRARPASRTAVTPTHDPQRRAEAHAAGPPGRACFSRPICCDFPPFGSSATKAAIRTSAARAPPPDDGSPENVSRGRSDAGIDLAELKRGQCRYLIGELQPRRLLYCGKPSVLGKSWCAAHRRLCVTS